MAPLAAVSHTDRTATVSLIGDADVNPDDMPTVKCVLVGDGAVGKTSLLVSYAVSECPANYEPTAFDNYAVVVRVDDKPIRLQLCDTAGQLELDTLRALCYTNADVFLVCFSVVCPPSFDAVVTRWLPEVRRCCPTVPIILVGTQSDLRPSVHRQSGDGDVRGRSSNSCSSSSSSSSSSTGVVSVAEATALADRVGAAAYVECSASLKRGVKDVFDSAIVVSLQNRGLIADRRQKRGIRRLSTKKVKQLGLQAASTGGDDLGGLLGGVERGVGRKRRWWRRLGCCLCCGGSD